MAIKERNDWENPQVVGRNKQPAHATLLPYANESTALAGERGASPYFQLLNGDWQFHFAPTPAAAPQDFYKPDFDARSWDRIPVPSGLVRKTRSPARAPELSRSCFRLAMPVTA